MSQDAAALLIVDDNEDNRFTLVNRLKRQGYTNLTTAVDGRQALRLLRERPFDLVLLDIMMPEMNGYQVLEHLKGDGKLRHLPVIMISAVDEFESVIRCIELGAEDYLPKPFNSTLLRARIGACLEKKRLQDQVRAHLDRIEGELQAARELQKGMVPSDFPPPTAASPVEVYAAMDPARQVGGDLYDFFTTEDGGFWFLVGDVSDKGVPAALFMARTKTLFRLVTDLFRLPDGTSPEPQEVLARVNQELCRDNAGCMFVTVFLGRLEPGSGALRFCNAGHAAPYLLTASGDVRPLSGGGKPLGVRERLGFEGGGCRLVPGDGLFLFTDGIPDALDPDGVAFSEERLVATLRGLAGKPPSDVVPAVLGQVREFARATPQQDDITMLAIRLRAVGGPNA